MMGDRRDHRDRDVQDARDVDDGPPVLLEELDVVHSDGEVTYQPSDGGEDDRLTSSTYVYLDCAR